MHLNQGAVPSRLLRMLQPVNLRLGIGPVALMPNPGTAFRQRVYPCPSEASVGRASLNPWSGSSREAVGRAGLDPMHPVPDSRDWNPPRFSAGKRGKSQKLNLVVPPVVGLVNDLGAKEGNQFLK